MAKKQAKKAAPQRNEQPAWQKNLITHGGIILAFLLIVVGYFKPAVLDGKRVNQHDIIQFQGMAKETVDFREETGEEALWVSSLFSGMPAFQTNTVFTGDLFHQINKVLWLGIPRPANYIFMCFLGFYLLLLTLRVNPLVSAVGAAAFALSSYFFIILGAGHTSKANAIAYMAPVIAGIIMTYRGKYLLGAAMTAFFLALEITTNHYQITYYLALMVLGLGIAYFVDALREKTLPNFAKASGALIIAAILGVGPNAGRLLTTQEYAAETIRGKSELKAEQAESSGLDPEYAFRWSYGKFESFSLLVPNITGGGSVGNVGENATFNLMKARGGAAQAKRAVERWPTYWGDQPGTSGPVYVGAIICFLFVLGLLIVPGNLKWWLLGMTIVSLMMSWGRNFMGFNEFLFNYLPAYNKFRAPSIILVIAEFTMPLLGILAVDQVIKRVQAKNFGDLQKKLMIAAGIVGGLALFFALLGPSMFDFTNESQYNSDLSKFSRMLGQQTSQAQVQQFIDAAIEDRGVLMRNDALRSLLFILLSGGLLFLFIRQNIKLPILAGGLALLMVADMLPINRRYLNEDSFISQRQYEANFRPTQADNFILQDKDPNFRVLNLTTDTWNESMTSYHHKNVGGYHAAKLRRYSDMISRHLGPEMNEFIGVINAYQSNRNDSLLRAGMSKLGTLNMLNTRYFILNPEGRPLQNLSAYGNAWFVNRIQQVQTPDEEINALNDINPRNVAVVDASKYGDQLPANISADPAARITLTDWKPNHLTYSTKVASPQVAIFSEVYYNSGKGWQAYLDGQKVDHFRANYILRGINVPAGEHTIEFKFEPGTYAFGNMISMIFSILLLLLAAGAAFLAWREQQAEA
ncbi:MAG: YfhO family protein [Bacteroidota bacterium]